MSAGNSHCKDYANAMAKARYGDNFNHRIKVLLRGRLRKTVHTKSNSMSALLGCSIRTMREHLENQLWPLSTVHGRSFPAMTRENILYEYLHACS